jgi:hypothetical protein
VLDYELNWRTREIVIESQTIDEFQDIAFTPIARFSVECDRFLTGIVPDKADAHLKMFATNDSLPKQLETPLKKGFGEPLSPGTCVAQKYRHLGIQILGFEFTVGQYTLRKVLGAEPLGSQMLHRDSEGVEACSIQ